MARQAKILVNEQGVLLHPSHRKSIFPKKKPANCVSWFHKNEVSRVKPGKIDYKSVKEDGKKSPHTL